MEKQTKIRVVSEVSELAQASKAIVLAGFSGLTVEDETRLRREIRKAAGKYRVVRNTLARRALSGDEWAELRQHFQGNTAMAFADDDVVALMKTLVDFAKENEALTIKGGVLDGKALTPEEVKTIASLPSREVLVARLLSAMQSPLTGLMNVLTGSVRNLAMVLKAVADKRSEAGEA